MLYQHFCFDIETRDGRPEDAHAWARNYWSPSDAWKDDTIGARYRQAVEGKRQKLALIDTAPVCAIGVKTELDATVWHCLGQSFTQSITDTGVMTIGCESERQMLISFRDRLLSCTPDTVFIGHNLLGFDLPKLRFRYLANGLQLPAAFVPNADIDVFDSMKKFERFSLEQKLYISLTELRERLGMPAADHKTIVSGEQIPALAAAGNVDAIVNYVLCDVLLEYDTFLRMSGLRPDDAVAASPVTGTAVAA